MLKLKDASVCDGDCSFRKAAECYYYSQGAQKILGPLYYPLQMYVRRKMSEKADAIVCVSENIKSYIVKLFPQKKIIAMPSDIIVSNAALKVDELKSDLLYVGALGRYKGCEYLIEAMKYIVLELGNCRLRIVGDGPKRNEYEQLSRSMGLEKNISFEGFVPHNKIPEYYASTKIVVFPSVVPETFGRIAAEAMVMGKPVIATRTGGIPEIVRHGENGIIVQPKNSRKIADAAIYLLKNETLADRMGKNGQKYVEEKYSPSIIAKKYFGLYEKLRSSYSLFSTI
jgi:glycosyltransferase involved in cell wall biosynthesis